MILTDAGKQWRCSLKLNRSLMEITKHIEIDEIFDVSALEINKFLESKLLLLGLYNSETKILNFNKIINNGVNTFYN